MSKGGLKEFLSALFAHEGGAYGASVVNSNGYVGKYQFGETALEDLGYYKSDGASPYVVDGNGKKTFRYQWKGTWTGKAGIYSLNDFKYSPAEQDIAAAAWIKLLCARGHKLGVERYEGTMIKGAIITHSGIIAGAHLKGFGTSKSPGTMDFLRSTGEIDPTDGNRTPVSRYISEFADYELGCCSGTLNIQFSDKEMRPISGIAYQVKNNNKVLHEGSSTSGGTISQPIKNISFDQQLEVWVRESEENYEMVWRGSLYTSYHSLTLTSPTIRISASTDLHDGPPGDHRRNSKLDVYEVKHGDTLWAIARQHGVTVSKLRRVNPDLNGDLIKPRQKIRLPSRKTVNDASMSEIAQDRKPQAESTSRNDNGHPIAIAEPASERLPPETDSVKKMFEILERNAKRGKKHISVDGLAAAKKAIVGLPISDAEKPPSMSLGFCYKYVKIALLASGMVHKYLSHGEAKDAGVDLEKEGFKNVLDDPKYHINSPYGAPIGSIIVYGTTDGSPHGHIEVVMPGHWFASDYISPNSRVMPKNAQVPTLVGRGRKITGVWVK